MYLQKISCNQLKIGQNLLKIDDNFTENKLKNLPKTTSPTKKLNYGKANFRNDDHSNFLLSAKNGSGPTETKQWQDMIAKPRQSIVVWHRLKPGD